MEARFESSWNIEDNSKINGILMSDRSTVDSWASKTQSSCPTIMFCYRQQDFLCAYFQDTRGFRNIPFAGRKLFCALLRS